MCFKAPDRALARVCVWEGARKHAHTHAYQDTQKLCMQSPTQPSPYARPLPNNNPALAPNRSHAPPLLSPRMLHLMDIIHTAARHEPLLTEGKDGGGDERNDEQRVPSKHTVPDRHDLIDLEVADEDEDDPIEDELER